MTGAGAVLGVVVPARDEQELLPACLAAIESAARHPALVATAVTVVVVDDGSTDATAEVARAAGAVVVPAGSGGNVGIARDRGVRWLLAESRVPAEQVWIAGTDADSEVPGDWLAEQLRVAREGWDAAVGTVAVIDWSGHPASVAVAFDLAYEGWRRDGSTRLPTHPHVHGTNLGVRGSAYLAAGGFPPLSVHEDVALVQALVAGGARVLRSPATPVRTSTRRAARAVGGFGDHLQQLAVPGRSAGS